MHHNFFITHLTKTIAKATYLAVSIGLLTLTACDKASNTASTQTSTSTSTTSVTTTSSTATISAASAPVTALSAAASSPATTAPLSVSGNTTAAAATVDQIMSMLGSGMAMANKMVQTTDTKSKFTAEQISCVATKNNDAAVGDMQVFYNKT